MAETQYDVLCAGLIVADHVCAPIERIPPAGQLEMTDRIDLTIGGCGSNVAVDLSRLELRACVAGRVGNDAVGRHVCQALEEEGVACEQVTFSETAQTSTTMVVNVKGEDRRFIHAAGANAEFTGAEIAAEAIRNSRALYVGGFGLNAALSGENVAALFEVARGAGVLTVLDVVVGDEDVDAMLRPVLPVTDLFLPNDDEAHQITGLADPIQQAERFRSLGAGCVVVTCGHEGSVLVDGESTLRVRAHRVEQVDPTGGGDAFVAGFLYGRLSGCGPNECLRFGAALGASCVQSRGATTGVFRRAELEEFVRENPLAPTARNRGGV
mgnify:FL=1